MRQCTCRTEAIFRLEEKAGMHKAGQMALMIRGEYKSESKDIEEAIKLLEHEDGKLSETVDCLMNEAAGEGGLDELDYEYFEKKKYREYRKIFGSKVRKMCEEEEMYTKGTDEEYTNLLEKLCDGKAEQTMDSLKTITEDILKHSNVEKLLERYDIRYRDTLFTIILQKVISECCQTFIERI